MLVPFTGADAFPVAASATTSVVDIPASLLLSLAQPPRVSTAWPLVPHPADSASRLHSERDTAVNTLTQNRRDISLT